MISIKTTPVNLHSFRLGVVIFFIFSLLFSGLSLAQKVKQRPHGNLSKGIFLVATDNLNGFSLKNAVIYITQHDSAGTSGFIVNRPTNLTINEAFPKTNASNQTNNTLFFGGPLHSQYLFILTKTDRPSGLYAVSHSVYFATGEEMESRLHSETQDTIRTYAGFMSWGPGQLEEELTDGDWVLAPGNPKELFSNDTSDMWKTLYRLWAGSWT